MFKKHGNKELEKSFSKYLLFADLDYGKYMLMSDQMRDEELEALHKELEEYRNR
ncbi:MAG: hypothetical protein ILP07_03660 [Treponema sp.]|nr:hypothetical protein [Treponema sp.]